MEFIDPTKEGDEKYVGADIELAHHIADELGVECHIIPLDFTSVLSGVITGKYDMAISALAYTPERRRPWSFRTAITTAPKIPAMV